MSCRGEEDRGEEVKKLLNACSPRRSPLQAWEKTILVSKEESKMTRRSINQANWAEGWEAQRILYARDTQTGDRKVDVLSFFACMQCCPPGAGRGQGWRRRGGMSVREGRKREERGVSARRRRPNHHFTTTKH